MPSQINLIRLQTLLVGLSTALAFLLPETIYSAILGWTAVIMLVHLCRVSNNNYRYVYLAFVIAHAIAFYWLADTIAIFGNFPYWAAYLIYILFAFTNSLYILVAPFLLRYLPDKIKTSPIAPALAFSLAEFLAIRIFPWSYAHTQIAFTPFVQIADIAGITGVSLALFYLAASVEQTISTRRLNRNAFISVVVLLAILTYGQLRLGQYSDQSLAQSRPIQKVAMIQGNIPINTKHTLSQFRENIETYIELGLAYEQSDTLIIWPETVIMSAIPTEIQGHQLPFLSPLPRWLVGTMMTDEQGNYYNSALGIDTGSNAFAFYHKLILMPFGEYAPLSKTFPWILDLAHMEGELTPGVGIDLITYPATDTSPKLIIAPLICYEDLVATLSKESVNLGANLLVNITNDAWFGDSLAPYQHNLLATFRAIENRRYLLRASNTGLTSIITPIGKTASQLRTYSQGVLSTEVSLIEEKSIYSGLVGDTPWVVLAIISLVLVIVKFRKHSSL